MNHRPEESPSPASVPDDAAVLRSLPRQGVLSKKDVFRWSIPAALVHHHHRGEARSDAFAFGNAKYCLSLSMDPEKSEYLHDQFGVCLHRTTPAKSPGAAVRASFALLDTRDRLHYACERVMRHDSDRAYATFDASVLDKHQQIFLRKDGTLSVHCALDADEILSEEDAGHSDAPPPPEPSPDGSVDLVGDLTSLLDGGKFCDVTLCARGEEFRAHRSILGARSPVFAAMFEHDTRERAEERVDMPDVGGEVLRQLLRYVYTGGMEEGTEPRTALALLAAADKYALPGLKRACSALLRARLAADSALGVLAVADLHGDGELREAAVRTVLAHAVQVMKTDDWLAFLRDYSELANCVILRLAMQK